MQIKDLAQASGVPADTIRHYERAGLLRPPQRAGNNYRRYAEADVQRLRFIRNCRALDMSLEEVRTLLDCLDHPPPDCSPVTAVISGHLDHVRQRLATLRLLEQQLVALQHACTEPGRPDLCGMVLALSGPQAPGPAPGPQGAHGAVHGR